MKETRRLIAGEDIVGFGRNKIDVDPPGIVCK
jgi:hypothetical protein